MWVNLFCAICGKGVEVNSIQSRKSMKWVHKKCAGIKGSLAKVKTFDCNMSKPNQVAVNSLKSANIAGDLIEKVEMFCAQKTELKQ